MQLLSTNYTEAEVKADVSLTLLSMVYDLLLLEIITDDLMIQYGYGDRAEMWQKHEISGHSTN